MRSALLLSILGVLLLLNSCGTAPDTTEGDDADAASIDSASSTEEQPDQTWVTAYPSLKKYAIQIIEAPEDKSVGHEIVIAVSAGDDIEIDAAVWRPGSKSSISGAARGEKSNGTWQYTVKFPETGEFDVTLSARGPDDEQGYYYGVAKWSLHAEVPEDKEWTSPSERPSVETVSTVEKVEDKLFEAVEEGQVEEIRKWFKRCESADSTCTDADTRYY